PGCTPEVVRGFLEARAPVDARCAEEASAPQSRWASASMSWCRNTESISRRAAVWLLARMLLTSSPSSTFFTVIGGNLVGRVVWQLPPTRPRWPSSSSSRQAVELHHVRGHYPTGPPVRPLPPLGGGFCPTGPPVRPLPPLDG